MADGEQVSSYLLKGINSAAPMEETNNKLPKIPQSGITLIIEH